MNLPHPFSLPWLQSILDKGIKDPRQAKNQHVYILFHDSEVSMTKAGDLFGQRTMSCQHYGLTGVSKFIEGLNWPSTFNGHPCVFFDEIDDTELLNAHLMIKNRLDAINPLDEAAKAIIFKESLEFFDRSKNLLSDVHDWYWNKCDAAKRPAIPDDYLSLPKYLENAARLHENLQVAVQDSNRRAISILQGYLSHAISDANCYVLNITAWFERVRK